MADLKYGDDWLIPLQAGYRVEYPLAGAVQPRFVGGYPEAQIWPQRVIVNASYRLTSPTMIEWARALLAGANGRITAQLDTAGYITDHDCVIIEPPTFGDYRGHTATLTLRMACIPSPPVVTQYASSRPYPESISDDMTAGAQWTFGKLLGVVGFEEDSTSIGAALTGILLKGTTVPYDLRAHDLDSASIGAALTGILLKGTIVPFDLRAHDLESASIGAAITSVDLRVTGIPYNLATHDLDTATIGATVTGITLS